MDRLRYQRDVDRLEIRSHRYEQYFESPAGLGVRVSPRSNRFPEGRKVYFVFYRNLAGRFRRYTLGDCRNWRLGEAKTEAERMKGDVARGTDPQDIKLQSRAAEKEEQAMRRRGVPRSRSLEAFLRRYFEDPAFTSLKSAKEKRRVLERDLLGVLGDRQIDEVTRDDIRYAVTEKGPTRAGVLLLSHTKTFYKWALLNGYVLDDPTAGVVKPMGTVHKRKRYLRPREIPVFWKATQAVSAPYGNLFRFALLTAARRGECASLEWSEIDWEERVWRLPARKAKNNIAHLIPLSTPVIELLRSQVQIDGSPYVFARPDGGMPNGWSVATKALNEACGFYRADDENADGSWISPHDLRRTAATGLARLRIPPHVRERVLCHVQKTLDQSYDHWDYVDEKREALDAWSERVLALTGDNVVELVRR